MTNLKNLLLENYSKYFDDLLSGERSLPFGLLVYFIMINYIYFQGDNVSPCSIPSRLSKVAFYSLAVLVLMIVFNLAAKVSTSQEHLDTEVP